jgi:hypothetical protein
MPRGYAAWPSAKEGLCHRVFVCAPRKRARPNDRALILARVYHRSVQGLDLIYMLAQRRGTKDVSAELIE